MQYELFLAKSVLLYTVRKILYSIDNIESAKSKAWFAPYKRQPIENKGSLFFFPFVWTRVWKIENYNCHPYTYLCCERSKKRKLKLFFCEKIKHHKINIEFVFIFTFNCDILSTSKNQLMLKIISWYFLLFHISPKFTKNPVGFLSLLL